MRDMWLTGFDAPSLHTMYVDKPMRGHGLMQAIARVNRVFKDKPGGLVVDYLGLADELKQALATYTESGGTGKTALDQAEAVALMLEKHEVCRGLFHGFDWTQLDHGHAAGAAVAPAGGAGAHPGAGGRQEPAAAGRDGAVAGLRARGAARGGAADPRRCRVLPGRAGRARQECGRRAQDRRGAGPRHPPDHFQGGGLATSVIDIFAAAGLKKPDISILSDEFLAEVRGMPQRNLAVELLQKLLKGEIKNRAKRNVVQARSFAEMLESDPCAATRTARSRRPRSSRS